MERRSLLVATVVLVGGAALLFGVWQAEDPLAISTLLGAVLTVGMGVALVAALLADRKHLGAPPRQSWFVVVFIALLGAAAAAFANGVVAIAVAALFALATAIVLFVRMRPTSNGERPHAAR